MKAGKLIATVVLIVAALFAARVLFGPSDATAPLISNAKAVPLHGAPASVAIYLKIENRGGANVLLSATSPEAETTKFIGSDTATISIPAGGSPVLSSDGVYLRLDGLDGPEQNGRLIPLTLTFENGGKATTRAMLELPDAEAAKHAGHTMSNLYVAAEDEPVPDMTMTVSPDSETWVVSLKTQNIKLSADLADGPHQPGTGHAHLYLNGLKLQRMYSSQAVIGALPPGQHKVVVTLNTNDHKAYSKDGNPITAMALIDVR